MTMGCEVSWFSASSCHQALGMDTTAFAAAIAPLVKQIRLLMAVRIGEDWPSQLARRIATLDRNLGGRQIVNIISSDLPGETMDGMARYPRQITGCRQFRRATPG